MIHDVQPPRGSRRDDTPMRRVKEELEDVKPPVCPTGFEVPPALQDEAHDGDSGLTFAIVESAAELERDPGLWTPSSTRR